jgi:hypothetical protein
MRKIVTGFAAAAFATSAAATPPLPPPAPPAPPPKLLIVISVDQLAADLWDEYRPHFTGGLARLAGGTVFRNGYQSHAATETCPGHATVLTGSRPARNGIVANLWTDQSIARPNKNVYCAEDERSTPAPGGAAYTVSAVHLKAPTLGELLKQRSPASRNVAIGGKDRSAVMMGGRSVDQRWYLQDRRFATDLPGARVPQSIAAVNAAMAGSLAAPRPPLEAPPLCAGKSRVVPIEGGGKPVGNGRFARAAGDLAAFRASPEFDATVLALAAALTLELKLGNGRASDVLSIGLAGTDYVGHTFGIGGQEMCLQLLSLDRDLGDFFGLLDRTGIDYAVALTADHGGDDIPERLRLNGVSGAARVDPVLSATQIGRAVGAKLGLRGPVLIGEYFGDVYLHRDVAAADRSRALNEAASRYRAHPQVEAVFTKADVARTPMRVAPPDRWTIAERVRASFDPQRSGDLYVVLKQHVTPISDTRNYVATHGSPWDYDRRVPIVFWRRGMTGALRNEAVETVDIMPTLAAMLGLAVDRAAIDGRCLTGVAGVACPPRLTASER